MPKAPATIPSLPPARRGFEPARYSQHYLASAYLQLVPGPRRRVLAWPHPAPATPAARASVAS